MDGLPVSLSIPCFYAVIDPVVTTGGTFPGVLLRAAIASLAADQVFKNYILRVAPGTVHRESLFARIQLSGLIGRLVMLQRLLSPGQANLHNLHRYSGSEVRSHGFSPSRPFGSHKEWDFRLIEKVLELLCIPQAPHGTEFDQLTVFGIGVFRFLRVRLGWLTRGGIWKFQLAERHFLRQRLLGCIGEVRAVRRDVKKLVVADPAVVLRQTE